jgi:hypothetical protein
MPRRIEEMLIHRRYSNGACAIERLCRECGKKFVGERNICPPCRNLARAKTGKFNADYHRDYYHRKYSKAVMQQDDPLFESLETAGPKRKAFLMQKDRIRCQLAAIAQARLSPDNGTVLEIEEALEVEL